MNNDNNRKATRSLAHGDHFSYKGEVATFGEWYGYPRDTRYGVYRTAFVVNGDGHVVKWSLNMAGSVEVF